MFSVETAISLSSFLWRTQSFYFYADRQCWILMSLPKTPVRLYQGFWPQMPTQWGSNQISWTPQPRFEPTSLVETATPPPTYIYIQKCNDICLCKEDKKGNQQSPGWHPLYVWSAVCNSSGGMTCMVPNVLTETRHHYTALLVHSILTHVDQSCNVTYWCHREDWLCKKRPS